MSAQDAIAECLAAHRVEGARWPVPLLRYLDDPPDHRRTFSWLCTCVEELLEHLGVGDRELADGLAMARRFALLGGEPEPVERKAWALWTRRGGRGDPFSAVAQLLFALSRGRDRGRDLLGSCATPLCLLERLEARRGEVLERVIALFLSRAGGPID